MRQAGLVAVSKVPPVNHPFAPDVYIDLSEQSYGCLLDIARVRTRLDCLSPSRMLRSLYATASGRKFRGNSGTRYLSLPSPVTLYKSEMIIDSSLPKVVEQPDR